MSSGDIRVSFQENSSVCSKLLCNRTRSSVLVQCNALLRRAIQMNSVTFISVAVPPGSCGAGHTNKCYFFFVRSLLLTFPVQLALQFVLWTNKCTIDQQFIILLFVTLPLHVSTLWRHLQGARSQYLLSYISMWIQYWWHILKLYICFIVII